MILILPETGDRPLPTTLHDIHQLYQPLPKTETASRPTHQGTEMDEMDKLASKEEMEPPEINKTTAFV